MPDERPTYTRGSEQFCGKLVAIVSSDLVADGKAIQGVSRAGQAGYCVVEFPCMPDDITLARRATYDVKPNMFLPDALHFYQYTSPMEIPFSFRLHASDEAYCGGYGAMALLEIAARLHVLTLPFNPNRNVQTWVNYGQAQNGSDQSIKSNSQRALDTSAVGVYAKGFGIKPPVACSLQLMQLSRKPTGFGINCRGYVKDVSVKLMGPWLRGADGQYNIPTAADYSFTFVHVPGYDNSYFSSNGRGLRDQQVAQAYADDVRTLFYNTAGIIATVPSGKADSASTESTPTSAVLSAAGPVPASVTNPEGVTTSDLFKVGRPTPALHEKSSAENFFDTFNPVTGVLRGIGLLD